MAGPGRRLTSSPCAVHVECQPAKKIGNTVSAHLLWSRDGLELGWLRLELWRHMFFATCMDLTHACQKLAHWLGTQGFYLIKERFQLSSVKTHFCVHLQLCFMCVLACLISFFTWLNLFLKKSWTQVKMTWKMVLDKLQWPHIMGQLVGNSSQGGDSGVDPWHWAFGIFLFWKKPHGPHASWEDWEAEKYNYPAPAVWSRHILTLK